MEEVDALEALTSPEGFQFDCKAPSPRASSPATPRLFGDPLINHRVQQGLPGSSPFQLPVRGLQSPPPGSGGGRKSMLKDLFSVPDAGSSQGRSAVKVAKNSKTNHVNRVFGCISDDPVLDSIRRGFDRSSSRRRRGNSSD